jgi:hypothetical protein
MSTELPGSTVPVGVAKGLPIGRADELVDGDGLAFPFVYEDHVEGLGERRLVVFHSKSHPAGAANDSFGPNAVDGRDRS